MGGSPSPLLDGGVRGVCGDAPFAGGCRPCGTAAIRTVFGAGSEEKGVGKGIRLRITPVAIVHVAVSLTMLAAVARHGVRPCPHYGMLGGSGYDGQATHALPIAPGAAHSSHRAQQEVPGSGGHVSWICQGNCCPCSATPVPVRGTALPHHASAEKALVPAPSAAPERMARYLIPEAIPPPTA